MNIFYVFSAGCIRRGLDIIHIQNYLQQNGWTMSRRPENADLLIIATCGVVELNELNSLRCIMEGIRRKKDDARIVITGCLPLINPGPIEELGESVFIPTGQLDKLDEFIGATVPFSEVEYPDSISDNRDIVNYLVARSFCRQSALYKKAFYKFFMDGRFLEASITCKQAYESVKAWLTGKPKRKFQPYYNVKIADGCLSNCSFCATKYATGTLRSRPLEDIVSDFRRGLRKGYKVFQLIAEDTGCYGRDSGSSLTTLLTALCEHEGDFQFIIIDCSPQWLVEDRREILPVLAKYQHHIRELFVPLQSGSDSVLKAMHRKYAIKDALAVLGIIRTQAPGITLRTSLLIGFPGETPEDFEASRCAAKALDFAEVTINRYEDRPKALSATLPGKVSQSQIEHRARILAEDGCYILS